MWTPWATDATLETAPLAPGVHEFEVRAKNARNAAALDVETAASARVSVVVDASGGVSVVP
jgi:hypothetical protein